jgi:hypothetical protein
MINGGPTRSKLIKVLYKVDMQKAQKEIEKLQYINSFYTLYTKEKKPALRDDLDAFMLERSKHYW